MELKLPRRSAAMVPLDGEPNVRQVNSDFSIGGYGGWGQGWNGADYSPDRGYVYWPQDDARRDLPQFSLWEMRRRSRYLDANVGFAGRINRGVARMICGTGLMVRPTTVDRDWNRDRVELFKQRNGSADAVDVGRKWNFFSMQFGMQYCANVDGNMGAILGKNDLGMARLAFIEDNRIGNGRETSPGEIDRMIDGVLTDRNNAAVSYRVLGDDGTQADVPAAAFCYLGQSGRHDRHRTPPLCHRAINHLLDRTEIDRHFKKAIKNSSRIGYYIGTDATQTKKPGLPIGPVDRTSTASPLGKKINADQILDGGGGEIPDLDPGREIKLLLDARPHPNTLGFYDHLSRDISWGTDWPPEILWNIAALGNQGTRYVMAEAQSLVESGQQNLVDAALARYYFFDTVCEMAVGRLRRCQDPNWWKHQWLPPRQWTIDRSKDGKLHLEQVRSGALTFRRMMGWDSLDSDRELDEWMDEMAAIAERARQRGLDPEQVLNRIYGRPGTTNAVAKEEELDPNAEDDAKPAEDDPEGATE